MAISHTHADHAGNVDMLPGVPLLIQKAEYDSAFVEGRPAPFAATHPLEKIEGERFRRKLRIRHYGRPGELADDDDDLRVLIDGVATWKATPSLSLGLSVDAAREGRPVGDDVGWFGAGLYARVAPPNSRTALALRGEYYDDEDGAISGIAQTLKELTATLEHRPVPRLILKLEGRYDRSSAPAFADDTLDPDGAPFRKRNQFLVLLGAVATF